MQLSQPYKHRVNKFINTQLKPLLETKRGFSYLLSMLQFKQDNTAAVLILTLTEFVTLPAPYYLFVFTHVETKNVVAFVKAEIDDESDYPQRYNQFTIDAADIFEDQPTGEWHYKVYEQASAVNIDPDAAGGLLEDGKLILDRATAFEYTQYESSTSYKSYNG